MIEKIVEALRTDILLGVKGIYHQLSPHGCKYPNIVYKIISDVPALHGDNMELQSRVTVRIHIITKDGNYHNIYRRVNRIMTDLGFMRVQTVDMIEDGLKMKVIDYRTGVDAL